MEYSARLRSHTYIAPMGYTRLNRSSSQDPYSSKSNTCLTID